MSDVNSSLPVRTQNNGDVVVEIVDGTTPSQKLAVDSTGRITTKMDDGAGNPITSQVNGAQRALDVGINVAGVQIDPRAQGTPAAISAAWPVRPTDGTNSQSYTAAGEAKVSVTEPLPAGTNGIGSVNNFPAVVDTNFGVAGASTIRTAAEIGNATGAASFNNGTTGAQTLRVAANLAIAGADVTALNPIPVTITSSVPGTSIHSAQTSASLAAAASIALVYTVTVAKTLNLARVFCSASGKIKAVVAIETGLATGVFTTNFVGFNSTANPQLPFDYLSVAQVAAGVRVQATITNLDLASQDVYATFEGTEV